MSFAKKVEDEGVLASGMESMFRDVTSDLKRSKRNRGKSPMK
jgi:hypothetical protein